MCLKKGVEAWKNIFCRVRATEATELLKSKKYNVQEAAEAVGYNDIPTFRKHFVDFYGVTPSAFSKEEGTEKK